MSYALLVEEKRGAVTPQSSLSTMSKAIGKKTRMIELNDVY
jgi:hypothetical protein